MDLFARRTGLQFFRCCGFTSICTGLVLPADNFVQSLGRADQSVPLPAWGLRFLSVFCSDHSPTMNRFWALDVGQTDRRTDASQRCLMPKPSSNGVDSNSVFSFLRQPATWHCSHLQLNNLPLSIDISCSPGPQQQTRRTLLQRSIDVTDWRTSYRYIDPVALYASIMSATYDFKVQIVSLNRVDICVCTPPLLSAPPSPLTGWVSPFETLVDAPRMRERVRSLFNQTDISAVVLSWCRPRVMLCGSAATIRKHP